MRNDQVNRIVNIPRLSRNSVVIRWQVTSLCNYNCDFCIQGSREAHIRASKVESREKRKEIAECLVNYIETKVPSERVVELFLIGGEVTILKDFPEILGAFVNCGFRGRLIIQMTTNFSKDADYYASLRELFKGRKNRTLKLSASYYRAYTSIETFKEKVARIGRYSLRRKWNRFFNRTDINIFVGVPILDDESYLLLEELRGFCARYSINVSPIVIRSYTTILSENVKGLLKSKTESSRKMRVSFSDGSGRYFDSIQQLGIFLEDGDGRFSPLGFYCDAGQKSFSVSPDGIVSRCPVLSENDIPGHRLGVIKDIDTELLTAPARCMSSHCSCNYFTCISHV